MKEWYSKCFEELGYDLAFMDLRNHGRSSANYRVTVGIEESQDVKAVLKWMGQRDWKHIVVFGTSMGGIASVLAVPAVKREGVEIRGLILDSIFLDIRDTVNRVMKKHFIVQPYLSLIDLIFFSIRFRSLNDVKLEKQLKKIQGIQKLVLLGSEDVETAPDVWDQIRGMRIKNLQTYMVQGGEHSRLFVHPEFCEEIKALISRI